MANEFCRLPSASGDDDSDEVGRMLRAGRIAIVGLSDDPSRVSFGIGKYLLAQGKEIVPVNPNCSTVLGQKAYPSLEAVPGPIDLVNVFRRPEHCADIVRSAIAVGAKGVWLQTGVFSAEAQRLAEEAGMPFVQDRCIMVEHMQAG